MIKKILIVALFSTAIFSFAQYRDYGDHYGETNKTTELKVNALTILTYGAELGFEKSVTDGIGLGTTVMIPYHNTGELEWLNTNLNYYVSPYARYYMNSNNSGVFFEGFGLYANRKDPNYTSSSYTQPNYSTFGLGIGGGTKWVNYSGFTLEASAGVGRNFILPEDASLLRNFIFKAGVSAGFRF